MKLPKTLLSLTERLVALGIKPGPPPDAADYIAHIDLPNGDVRQQRIEYHEILELERVGIDMKLWVACQRVTYPGRYISVHPPFFEDEPGLGPKRKPASWLYWLLFRNPELRAKVFP